MDTKFYIEFLTQIGRNMLIFTGKRRQYTSLTKDCFLLIKSTSSK